MTSDFHGQSRNSADLKNTLERIAGAGFSHVHWCHEFNTCYMYSVYEMFQIKEWCDEAGLLVKGVHASIGEKNSDLKNYISSNEYNRMAGVDLVKNRIEMARILETDSIVLHFNFPWECVGNDNNLNVSLKPVFKSLDELEPYCRIRKVKICIENSGGSPAQCNPVYDILFGRYSGDFLGLCFDTGHANHCKGNCLEYAQRYNDRLFMIHVDDNHGESDEHTLPFEGIFDWEGFVPVLAGSPYEFPVLLEPIYREEEKDDTAWLKRAFDAGNRFSEMVEKRRQMSIFG